ncbi:hypothetical protein U1Q18_032176 [Sarracenia purpurea var. burkii]
MLSNSRFGFVKFNEEGAVFQTMAKYNGVWCLYKKMVVMKALEGGKVGGHGRREPGGIDSRLRRRHLRANQQLHKRRMKGLSPKENQGDNIIEIIEAEEIDEGWLADCVVGIVKKNIHISFI